jgi:hypothetical protein
MDLLKKEIAKTLLYFDIFEFPLRMEEIHRFCGVEAGVSDIADALSEMLDEEQIFQVGDYYLVRQEEEWVRRRRENLLTSRRKMQTARRNAALISRFPYVRGVAVSGSLSKYSADEKADIDYFIIAHPRRLWICRSLLHLFKKFTYLAGKQHDFCMNYFLDQDELELKDKNLYTALEGATVIPLFGREAHREFFSKNNWIADYFPNFPLHEKREALLSDKRSPAKRLLEFIFAGRWGDMADAALRRITVSWWRFKFRRSGFPMEHFEHDLRATSGESKYHPYDYQRAILSAYRERVRAYEKKCGFGIH